MGKTNRDKKKFQYLSFSPANPEAFIRSATKDARRQPSEPKQKDTRANAKRQSIRTGW